jgi:hypothetical protein
MDVGFQVSRPLFQYSFKQNQDVLTNFGKTPNMKFHKNLTRMSIAVPWGKTDGRT